MVEYAQGWLGIALPLLSRDEPIPVLRADIRLLYKIFSGAMDVSEFQRQVSIPNVPKMTSVMIALALKHTDLELEVLILAMLSKLVFLYPNLHRASYSALSSLAMSNLDGRAPGPTNAGLMNTAAQLYVALHFTGGKLSAGDLWKKSIEETVAFGWNSFYALRTTFPTETQSTDVIANAGSDEPVVTIPLNLDRLRCCITILCDLLRAPTYRPVQLPLGTLVRFVLGILTCSSESQVEDHVDANVRVMEVAVVPEIWQLGCHILADLAVCVQHHLTPHLTCLLSCLAIHLERKPKTPLRLACLNALHALLMHCYALDSDVLPNRLAKSILPIITAILSHTSSGPTEVNQIRKGKKRGRNFEGEEILKSARNALCQSPKDEQALLVSLQVLRCLWKNTNLSTQMQSVVARNLLAVFVTLPRLPPALLSVDASFHARFSRNIQAAALDVGIGSSNVSSKSLGLIVAFSESEKETQRHFDLLLHPRVPPLIRRETFAQSLPSYFDEELQEGGVRADLGVTLTENPSASILELPKDAVRTTTADDEASPQEQVVATSNPVAIMRVNQPEHDALQTSLLVQDLSAAPAAIKQSRIQTRVQPNFPPPPLSAEDEEMPAIDMASDSDESEG
ncbi:hypothetical protein APHAL10511_001732 [Amanita phalloides]|nr:hypothetical protein APHAL10511_001732 [Amanita phalloides]